MTAIANAQIPDIPPMPTVPPAIYDMSDDAANAIDDLPTDPAVAGGVNLVPAPNAVPLFSYIKWLGSPSTTRELMGDQLHVFADMAILNMVALLTLTGVYLAVRGIVILIKIITFIFDILAKFPWIIIGLAIVAIVGILIAIWNWLDSIL